MQGSDNEVRSLQIKFAQENLNSTFIEGMLEAGGPAIVLVY